MVLWVPILVAFLSAWAGAPSLPHLSWFNPRERLVAVDTDRAVIVSLHTPEGKWLADLHEGPLLGPGIFQVPADLQPGLYLLRIRSTAGERLDRILMF